MPCDRSVNRRNSQLQNLPISRHYSEVPKFKLTKKTNKLHLLKLIEEQIKQRQMKVQESFQELSFEWWHTGVSHTDKNLLEQHQLKAADHGFPWVYLIKPAK